MTNTIRLSYPVLGAAVLASQLCLPIPSPLLLIGAGSLMRTGELELVPVLLISVVACLCGDYVWYEGGRRWGSRIMRVLTGFSDDPKHFAHQARDTFAKYGVKSLLVAKFIPGLDTVTPPIAGIEGVRRETFLLYDAGGSLIWTCVYVGCGYLFADSISTVTTWMERFGHALALLVGLPLLCFVVWRGWTTLHMLRILRMRRMSAALLHSKMEAGEKMAVIDLLNFEDTEDRPEGIPGAARLNPERLRKRSRIIAPADVQIVLYCSTVGEFRSARVAISLQRKGFGQMWVLEGGLQAWKDAGYPVVREMNSVLESAARLGIQIIET